MRFDTRFDPIAPHTFRRFLGSLATRSAASATLCLAACILACCGAATASAQGLVYVDANDGFVGTQNIFPSSAINSLAPGVDDLWGFREFGANGTIFESIGENAPEISQVLTSADGVAPSTQYDVYVAQWSATTENWRVRAGFTSNPGANTIFDRTGALGTSSSFAGAAVWSVLPPDNPTGSDDGRGVFLEGNRALYLGLVGTTTSTPAGEITVYVDDQQAGERSFFDGMAFVATGTPIALTATLNRGTGTLQIDNPTIQDFRVASYSITSAIGGLNSTTWSPIGTDADGDAWSVTAPVAPTSFATTLTEVEDAGPSVAGRLIASGGGSLNLGQVWNASPFQDVNIQLTLDDGTVLPMSPTYTGAAIKLGDFDSDGLIDVDDYQTLVTNMHADVSGLSVIESYKKGNISAGGGVDFTDFQQFRTAYIAENGAGAWAALGAVPEPATVALVGLAGALVAGRRRRNGRLRSANLASGDTPSGDIDESNPMTISLRGFSAKAFRNKGCTWALLLVVGLIQATENRAMAQLFDVNDDDAGGNTQAGWTATDATGINNVTFTAVGMDVVGNDPVTIDDRLRPGPYGGSEADMWLDFIFANGSNSEGSGMDVLIGGFTPNSVYNVKLWSFDTSSPAARSAFWNRRVLTFDGNSAEPTTLDEYNVTTAAIANASGQILLEGRTNLANSNNNQHNVFINGFEVLGSIDTLALEVNTTTGATRIVNNHNASFDLNYYEILSASDSLDNAGWDPLDPTPGGAVGANGWEAAGGSSSSILSETNLVGKSTLATSTGLSLGAPFGGGTQDLQFWYAAPDGGLTPGPVVYVQGGFAADFDQDGDVDSDDFTAATVGWQARFGADLDGGNFLAWQREFGSAGGSNVAAQAVPEPHALALAVLGCGAFVGWVQRSRRNRSKPHA